MALNRGTLHQQNHNSRSQRINLSNSRQCRDNRLSSKKNCEHRGICDKKTTGLLSPMKLIGENNESTSITSEDSAAKNCSDNNGQIIKAEERTMSDHDDKEDEVVVMTNGCGNGVAKSGSNNVDSKWSLVMNRTGLMNGRGSHCGLPKISIAEARSRNFLVGCASTWGSLLGAGQLLSQFPDRHMSLLIISWNMNCAGIPSALQDLLLPPEVDYIPDLYAIGIQEFQTVKSEWEVTVQETLGLSHILLHSATVGTLYIAIYIRRELIWFCSEPEDACVVTRPLVKTKGGIGISFQLFGTTFLFVNSHFKAHDNQLKERIEDFEKCRLGLDLPKNLPVKDNPRPQDATKRFDYVFWFGDLNFRVGLKREAVLDLIATQHLEESSDFQKILEHDQLKCTMTEGMIFPGFEEGLIRFAPTYRFDAGTDTYDTSEKQRIPGFTDRILFHSRRKGSVNCLQYNSIPNLRVSDHKPVYCLFDVFLSPGKDNVPLAAGQFSREIYLQAISRRAALSDPLLGTKSSAICNLQ